MDSPQLLKAALKRGTVLSVSLPEVAGGISRFWIILNDIKDESDPIHFVVCSSQYEEAMKWCQKNRPPLSTELLLFFDADELGFNEKQTVVNCHRVENIDFWKLYSLNTHVVSQVPQSILEKIWRLALDSKIVSNRDKGIIRKLLKNE